MSDATYEADFVLWAAHQAEALRRLQRGERANDVDWDNLIEEVESLGRSEAQATESLLGRALQHLLKAAAWPDAAASSHWLVEARVFLRDAGRRFTPSMARSLDVPALYRDALEAVALQATVDGLPARPLRPECPYVLAELIGEAPDVRAMAARAVPPG